jgi:hypothetical protein
MEELRKIFSASSGSNPVNSGILYAATQTTIKLVESLAESFPECPACPNTVATLQEFVAEQQCAFAEDFWKAASPVREQLLQRRMPSLEQTLSAMPLLHVLNLPLKAQSLDRESMEAIWQYVLIIMLLCEIHSAVPAPHIRNLETTLQSDARPMGKVLEFFQDPTANIGNLESLGADFMNIFTADERVEWERCAGKLAGVFDYMSVLMPGGNGAALNPQQLWSALAGGSLPGTDPMALLAGVLSGGGSGSDASLARMISGFSELLSPPKSQLKR